ncbi:MAG: beta-galactosidase [Bacteroidota bacterium]
MRKLLLTIALAYASLSIAFPQHVDNQHPDEALFSFGVIADVQYADAEKAGKRDYRNSPEKLEKCIGEFNNHNLSFTVTLGDLIDRDFSSFDKTLPILDRSIAPVYHVIGNHDFSVEPAYRKEVRDRLKNPNGYFDFTVDDFVFIVLDGTDLSTFGTETGSGQYDLAMAKFEEMKKAGLNNAYTWNGGIGSKQLKWLEKKLRKANHANKSVVLFCHWPLLPENGTQLWNNREVLSLINKHGNVIAWISGHHHAGGYLQFENIHHLTIKGMVEAQTETSCGIIEVYPDKLILNGYGDQEGQILEFKNNNNASVLQEGSHTFSMDSTRFFLDDKPFQIISGEMHYSRIPKEYWRHRIQMAKAMGCNTIATYVFWNYHETEEGKFDFESENRDLIRFIEIVQEEGMWLLFRPGPYSCGEWDLGGIPPYLLSTPDIKLRCMDRRYMLAVERYIEVMSEKIRPHLITQGGPIILLQIENEYGSYGNDREYMKRLKELWLESGIDVPYYTSDGATAYRPQGDYGESYLKWDDTDELGVLSTTHGFSLYQQPGSGGNGKQTRFIFQRYLLP